MRSGFARTETGKPDLAWNHAAEFDHVRLDGVGAAMTIFIAGSGLICAVMLALGFGFLLPIGSTIGDVCDLLAVGSGIFFVGLLDSK
jgi:hypothetical protein